MNGNSIKLACKDMIERLKPELYITITFRTPTSKYGTIRRIKLFFKFINSSDQVFYSKFLLGWFFFENSIKSEGYHVHGLIKGIDPYLASSLERRCNLSFGLSKVLIYDNNRINYPASEYLADKYVFYNYDDLEFFRINSRFRAK